MRALLGRSIDRLKIVGTITSVLEVLLGVTVILFSLRPAEDNYAREENAAMPEPGDPRWAVTSEGKGEEIRMLKSTLRQKKRISLQAPPGAPAMWCN